MGATWSINPLFATTRSSGNKLDFAMKSHYFDYILLCPPFRDLYAVLSICLMF